MSHLIRVFRATTKPGKEDAFQTFFVNDAVSIVRAFDGLVSVQVGLPTERAPRQFLMITTWTSVDALKAFAGASWEEAVIDPVEAPLLEAVEVYHYWAAAL